MFLSTALLHAVLCLSNSIYLLCVIDGWKCFELFSFKNKMKLLCGERERPVLDVLSYLERLRQKVVLQKSKESFLHKVIQFYKMVCCVVGNWVKLFFVNHNCIIVYHILHTIANVEVQKTSTLDNTSPNKISNRVDCCNDKKMQNYFSDPVPFTLRHGYLANIFYFKG